jgi:hypothetical protein
MSQVTETIGFVEIVEKGRYVLEMLRLNCKLEGANYKSGYFLRDFYT